MEIHAIEPFYVGRWRVEPRQNRIGEGEAATRVEPKVMAVLLCLAAQPGEVVTREALFETVWAGTVVSDDVLTRSISALRKVFGDDARAPTVIETIPKRGYRLLAPTRPEHRGDRLPPALPTLELSPPPAVPPVVPLPPPAPRRRRWGRVGLLGLLGAVMLGVVIWLGRFGATPPPGFHPVPLTSYPGAEGRAVLSPDGKMVAFGWAGPAGDEHDLYVLLPGAETPLRLTDDPAHETNPAFSADGSQLAFIRRDADGCGLFLVPALGGPSRRLASCGANIYGDLAWSPDGQWLAFNDKSDPAEAYRLVLLSPATLERRPLTAPPPDTWGDHDPAFSPDGTRLSFTRSVSEGMQDVYTVAVAGGPPARLTEDSRNIYGHTWTTDGSEVVFASNRTGRLGLWRIAAEGGTPAWVALGAGAASFPHIAGDRLVYRQRTGETNIWQLRIGQPETAAPLVASTRWDLHPSVSPDGRQLAFTSNRAGPYEIWRADRDGTRPVRLTHFDGPFTSTPRWSPDGQRLVFTARPGGQAALYVLDAGAAVPRRLTQGPADEMAADWTPDGKMLYFSTNRTGTWQVWRRPAAGGAATPVTTEGGFGPRVAPDGTALYFTRPGTPGLWHRPLGGGPPTRVLDALDPRDWGSWALHANGVFYIHRGSPSFLARHDLATARTDTVFIPPSPLPTMDAALALSPDGQWLLFGQADRSESDLMLVEDFR